MERGGLSPIVIDRIVDPAAVSVDERDEYLGLLEEGFQQLEAERTRTLAVSDENRDHDLFGYPSTVAYLKDRFRIAAGRAHRYVKLARFARRFQASFLAWKHRHINSDQSGLLARAAERLPDKYPDGESVVLEMIGDTPEETREILDYWTMTADPEPLDDPTQQDRRYLDYVRRPNGMVEGDFALPRLAGETLITAVEALTPPPVSGDERTASQRRADGFEDLARAFLDGAETPVVGGEKPHMNVHVDEPALEGTPGGLHETETGQVLTMAMVRQLACDSSVSRIVWNTDSEIIDVGRKTRVIPAALRRAVIARDRKCVVGGCGRSPRWADVHHLIHWADGGTTELSNLCLLCRYHHTLVHEDDEFEAMVIAQLQLNKRRRPI